MESSAWGDAWYARTGERPARELIDLFRRTADARRTRDDYRREGTSRAPTLGDSAGEHYRREGTSRAPTLGDWAQERVRTLFSEIKRRKPGARP